MQRELTTYFMQRDRATSSHTQFEEVCMHVSLEILENASVRKLQEKEHFDRVITGDTANHEQVFRNSPVFISGTSSSDTFDTRHLLHLSYTWTPTSFYNRNLLHHPSFTSVLYFYTNQLLPQTPFTPTSFYTRHLLHQPAFTLDTLYTRNLSRDTFHTRHSLHQTPFTRSNFLHHTSFYTRHLLHQRPFTLNTWHQPTFTPHLSYPTCTPVLYFYTNQLWHQTPLTPTSFYTRHLLHQPAFTPDSFYNLSHKTPFTPDSFDKRQLFTPQILLHQTPFTPDALDTKHPLHQPTFTPHLSNLHLLHQAPFRVPQAGRPGWIRASDLDAPYQNCLVVQTAAKHSQVSP